MKSRTKKIILTILCIICAGVFLFAAVQIFTILRTYRSASTEYDRLAALHTGTIDAAPANSGGDTTAVTSGVEAEATLEEINPDYIGWIQIPGTKINYPVVRGQDNSHYLTYTFEDTYNPVGSIFMDYRNQLGFGSQHTVVYGHNVKDGSMFGQLSKFLDGEFLAQNPTITVTTDEGTLTYQIFAARVTDMYDASYRLDFADDADFAAFATAYGAPEGTRQMLTLSTCTNVVDEERILVHAALL